MDRYTRNITIPILFMSRCFALFLHRQSSYHFRQPNITPNHHSAIALIDVFGQAYSPFCAPPLAICYLHAACRSSNPTYCLLASQMSISTNVASDGDRGVEPRGTNNTSGHDPLPCPSIAMPKTVPNLENNHRLDTPISATPSQFPAQASDVSAQSPSQTSPREPADFFNGVIYAASRPPKYPPLSIRLRNPRTHEMQNFCWSVPLVNDSRPTRLQRLLQT